MLFKKEKSTGPVDFIVVGLGNPGMQYEGTRHNAGFIALDALAEKLGASVTRVKYRALIGEARVGDKRLLLMKPQTFMNLSGEAVIQAMRFYKIPPQKALILMDDISLPVGVTRVRRKGSDGGQKGMRSIIGLADSEDFPRIKIGVGAKPHPDYDLAAWVLSKFTKEETPLLAQSAANAAEAACLIVQDRIDEAMNRYSK